MSALGYAVIHPEMGIFLGEAFGMGFWSKLDPVGQDAAVLFPSAETAAFVLGDTFKKGCQVVPVEGDLNEGRYASIPACVAAGLEAWDPGELP